jgi:hypothetical protein
MSMSTVLWQRGIISLITLNLIASLLLLFFPDLLIKMNNVASKWFSTNRLDEAINKRRDIDQSVMGSRKAFGMISFLFSLLLIYFYIRH